MKQDYLSQLNDIQSECANKFSDILRNIMVALCALAWAQLYLAYSPLLLGAIISVILYFICDVLNYFVAACISRTNLYRHKSGELTSRGVAKSMSRLNRFTFVMLCLKLMSAMVCFIMLIIVFVKQIYIN